MTPAVYALVAIAFVAGTALLLHADEQDDVSQLRAVQQKREDDVRRNVEYLEGELNRTLSAASAEQEQLNEAIELRQHVDANVTRTKLALDETTALIKDLKLQTARQEAENKGLLQRVVMCEAAESSALAASKKLVDKLHATHAKLDDLHDAHVKSKLDQKNG